MDLELAEAFGQVSTAECRVSTAEGNEEDAVPHWDSLLVDGPCSVSTGTSVEPAAAADSSPPFNGVVADMIDNIFRNVLVSIETNEVADSLVLVSSRPTPHSRPHALT